MTTDISWSLVQRAGGDGDEAARVARSAAKSKAGGRRAARPSKAHTQAGRQAAQEEETRSRLFFALCTQARYRIMLRLSVTPLRRGHRGRIWQKIHKLQHSAQPSYKHSTAQCSVELDSQLGCGFNATRLVRSASCDRSPNSIRSSADKESETRRQGRRCSSTSDQSETHHSG
ncbi:hypothetical protein BCV69DRAFT_190128 [Microstroma glucosiphilum]|uniref:Uncharacterized protein n=1 Tax=Pseudomicrostroma glucosiphilum TaxID=1684307 RepID=A0A316U8M2_9BASI|nr:hypothetical protein BCV69DRAFT_190128 [Pseudomicrostroma glucosiphilum]PWN21198.1 hypothetical protein BCV69DRAFT_190128 [Pseudomicrostroma glucosiphilum]